MILVCAVVYWYKNSYNDARQTNIINMWYVFWLNFLTDLPLDLIIIMLTPWEPVYEYMVGLSGRLH